MAISTQHKSAAASGATSTPAVKRRSAASEESAPKPLKEPQEKPLKKPSKQSKDSTEQANELPSLRFLHSPSLRQQTLKVLSAMEQSQAPAEHRDALTDIVVVLMVSGMDFYFLAPLKQAKAGFVIQQSANLGMVGVQQLMGGVIRNIIGRMDEAALLSICGSIRSMMH